MSGRRRDSRRDNTHYRCMTKQRSGRVLFGVQEFCWCCIRLCAQFPNYVLYPELELCLLWQNGCGSPASYPVGSCFLSKSYS